MGRSRRAGVACSSASSPRSGWPASAALSLSKILDNMEIGHNVLHGQYDWTNDPALSSTQFEWDSSCPAKGWQHYHNYLHHTFTNITEKDRDLGYGVIRISGESTVVAGQPRQPPLRPRPGPYLRLGHHAPRRRPRPMCARARSPGPRPSSPLKNGLRKSGKLAFRDYIMWPAFTGPLFLSTLAADALANVVRNIWSFIIIFCGHFPNGALEFTEEECEEESKGHWYFRQMLGSANISGRPPLPHHVREPELPDRAPPLPRHPGPALSGDRTPGARDLPALRHPLQHRPPVPAVRLGHLQDLPLRLPGPHPRARCPPRGSPNRAPSELLAA